MFLFPIAGGDAIPPEITISLNGYDENWTNSAVTVSASAVDGESGLDDTTWEYNDNGAGWTPISGTIEVVFNSTIESLSRNVQFRVKDKSGNQGLDSVDFNLKIDKTNPVINSFNLYGTPGAGPGTGGIKAVWNVSDDHSGLRTSPYAVSLYINGGSVSGSRNYTSNSASGDYEWVVFAQVSYTVSINVYDMVGNVINTSLSKTNSAEEWID